MCREGDRFLPQNSVIKVDPEEKSLCSKQGRFIPFTIYDVVPIVKK